MGTAMLALVVAGCAREEATGSPKEMLARGWQSLRIEEYESARIQFGAGLKRLDAMASAGKADPEDRKLRINALYGLGLIESLERSGRTLGNPGNYMRQVIALDPGGEMAAWAELALVREQHIPLRSTDAIDLPALRAGYAAILSKYPRTPAAEEAMVYLQSLRIQTFLLEDARSAVSDIETYLAAQPRSRMRSSLFGLHSSACVTLKDYPRALASAIDAVESKETNPDNPITDNAVDYYRIALMAAYDVGDLATARKYFRLLLEQYPADQRAFTVKVELQKLEQVEEAVHAGRWPTTAPATAEHGGRR